MKIETNPVIIFSVHRDDVPMSINHSNHETMHRLLQLSKVPFSPAVGVTKQWGKERSFVVSLPPRSSPEYQDRLFFILDLARGHKQEAVLYLHEDRFVDLIKLDGSNSTPLGYLKGVSEYKALELDDYTLVDGNYYSIVK